MGERSGELQDHVEVIMEGLQTVANILAVKKVRLDHIQGHGLYLTLLEVKLIRA